VLARCCAVSAPLCGVLHAAFELTVLPPAGAFLAAVAVGVAPLALANFAWDQGLRRGNGRLLAVMAYATPLLSALILTAAGLVAPTVEPRPGRADDRRRGAALEGGAKLTWLDVQRRQVQACSGMFLYSDPTFRGPARGAAGHMHDAR